MFYVNVLAAKLIRIVYAQITSYFLLKYKQQEII